MSDKAAIGPRIICSTVSLTINRIMILQNIDLCVEPGTIHFLIGPNGGGKSSLVKTILGQMRHAGMVSMEWPDHDRTIGYVPQHVAIDKTLPMTVRDFLAMCIQKRPALFGVTARHRSTIDEILALVQLTDKAQTLFEDLSGGERQRVIFAQALLPKPRLLILDEPMNSMDSQSASICLRLIQSLCAEGRTILWVHHDLAMVKKIGDQVTCIKKSVLFNGAPQQIMTQERVLEIFSTGSTE